MAQQQEPRCGGGGGGVRRDNKGAGRRHDGGVIVLEMGGGGRGRTEEEGTTLACRAVAAGVAVLGLAGAGVLVWWALAFHPAREQLWMVPVGLVLLGTPLVAWLSLFASGACWRHAADQPALAMTER